jgi:DNA-binding FadR family transcriptional regulator
VTGGAASGAPRPKRSFVIIDDVLRRIHGGDLVEGDLLPTEPILCEQYGVGRSAVREAMHTLVAKGFVEVRHGSRSTVAPRHKWSLIDPHYLAISGQSAGLYDNLLDAREIIEPAIAGRAAARATAADVQRLKDLVEQLGSDNATDPEEHAEIDIAFHAHLAQCTANPVLTAMHSSIVALGRAQRELMAHEASSVEHAVFWHGHIVEAIAAADSTAAEDAMRMHLRQVRADLKRTISHDASVAQPRSGAT